MPTPRQSRFKLPSAASVKNSPSGVGKKISEKASPTVRRKSFKVSTPIKSSPKHKHHQSSTSTLSPLSTLTKFTSKESRLGAIVYSPRKSKQNSKTVPTSLTQYDRFIPNRNAMDSNSSHFQLKLEADSTRPGSHSFAPLDPTSLAYQQVMAKACGVAIDKRILSFAVEPPPDRHDLRATWNRPVRSKPATAKRRIALAPEKILDAPGLTDDYYLNLIDWSSTNVLAVGLENVVYIWNGDTGAVQEFCKTQADDYVASLQWASDGSYLAVGTGKGDAQIWDVESVSKIRSMRGHTSRVGVLAWDQHILSSGCKDGSIWNHDVRIAEHKVAELLGHTSEVCGLQWRPDGAMLASGGNDNRVQIWDARSAVPKITKTAHAAAVKAIAWCPWQLNLLGTGGGSQDHMIHFWNTTTGGKISSIDTGSQVTSIQWSTTYKEFISSQDKQLSIWSYPSLNKIADLSGHDARILNTCISPDGETIASSSSDENLKFWKVFERQKGKNKSLQPSSGSSLDLEEDLMKSYGNMSIR